MLILIFYWINCQTSGIQGVNQHVAKVGFIDNFEEKDVYIEDLYEKDLYN